MKLISYLDLYCEELLKEKNIEVNPSNLGLLRDELIGFTDMWEEDALYAVGKVQDKLRPHHVEINDNDVVVRLDGVGYCGSYGVQQILDDVTVSITNNVTLCVRSGDTTYVYTDITDNISVDRQRDKDNRAYFNLYSSGIYWLSLSLPIDNDNDALMQILSLLTSFTR